MLLDFLRNDGKLSPHQDLYKNHLRKEEIEFWGLKLEQKHHPNFKKLVEIFNS